MSTVWWIAFALYAVTLGTSLFFGLRYFTAKELLPYQQQVAGRRWAEFDDRLRLLLMALCKLMGAGMISVAAGGFFILLIPFREGAGWANFALAAMTIIMGGTAVYVTTHLKRATSAETPVRPAIAAVAVGLIAFALRLA